MTKLESAINKVLRKWLGVKGAPADEFKNEAKEIAELCGNLAKENERLERELRRLASSFLTSHDSSDRRKIGQLVGNYIRRTKAGR